MLQFMIGTMFNKDTGEDLGGVHIHLEGEFCSIDLPVGYEDRYISIPTDSLATICLEAIKHGIIRLEGSE